MSQSDDLPPPRRPLFFPVVIATVLLSIIGMSAGLALGSRHQDPSSAGGQQQGEAPTDAPVDSGGAPDGIACPEQMHATAARLGHAGRLTQVLKVRADNTGAEVWICRDDDGKLYYQANTGGPDDWIEGETALFLDDVVPRGDGFLARAVDGNTFDVDAERLVVVRKGRKQTSPVTPE